MKSGVSPETKRFQALLAVHVVIGVLLAAATFWIMQLLRGTAENEIFGWLSLSGAGVGLSAGLFGLLLLVIGADILWAISLILLLVKKKLHLRDSDNTLRLP